MMYINNNLVDYVGGGCRITASYGDIIEPQPKETRTADEIISNITSRLNGTQNELI